MRTVSRSTSLVHMRTVYARRILNERNAADSSLSNSVSVSVWMPSGEISDQSKLQFAHPHNFNSSPIPLFSSTIHSRVKTELFKLYSPDSTHTPPRARPPSSSSIATIDTRCLLDLTFPDFDE